MEASCSWSILVKNCQICTSIDPELGREPRTTEYETNVLVDRLTTLIVNIFNKINTTRHSNPVHQRVFGTHRPMLTKWCMHNAGDFERGWNNCIMFPWFRDGELCCVVDHWVRGHLIQPTGKLNYLEGTTGTRPHVLNVDDAWIRNLIICKLVSKRGISHWSLFGNKMKIMRF